MRTLACCLLACLATAVELPRPSNPTLAMDAGGALGGWTARGTDAPLAAEDQDLPAGVDHAVRVRVDATASQHGQILQRLTGVPAGTRVRFSGWVRSEIPQGAYLQLKRFRGKEELARHGSDKAGPQWRQLTVVADTGEADAIELLLRWRREERFQRGRVWFGPIGLEVVE